MNEHRLFDAYLFIDWSASSKPSPRSPSKDSVWVAEISINDDVPTASYFRTRAECLQHLEFRLLDLADRHYRVLIGFDFPYGFPQGFGKVIGVSGLEPAWLATWNVLASKIKDSELNENNRFDLAADLNTLCNGVEAGPFWNLPRSELTAKIPRKRPQFPFVTSKGVNLPAFRYCESRLRAQGLRVHEVWKLYTAGSVGSQALTGIPYVSKLRFHPRLKRFSAVWPFETEFTSRPVPASGPFILHAEIWPGIAKWDTSEPVKDKAQVLAMARLVSDKDHLGLLAQLFDRPKGLSDDNEQQSVEEEGWILGGR